MEDEFKHGIDEQRAREYLKQIGIYDKLVESAKANVFAGKYPPNDGFMMVIAANQEFKNNNK